MKYRKKPVVIDAVQWDGDNTSEVIKFMSSGTEAVRYKKKSRHVKVPFIEIDTLEGIMYASVGDYIIKGVAGEYYPCKPDIFEKTYEKINE